MYVNILYIFILIYNIYLKINDINLNHAKNKGSKYSRLITSQFVSFILLLSMLLRLLRLLSIEQWKRFMMVSCGTPVPAPRSAMSHLQLQISHGKSIYMEMGQHQSGFTFSGEPVIKHLPVHPWYSYFILFLSAPASSISTLHKLSIYIHTPIKLKIKMKTKT